MTAHKYISLELLVLLGFGSLDFFEFVLLFIAEVSEKIKTGIGVDHVGCRNGLGEGPVNRLARFEPDIKLVTPDHRADIDA